MAYDVLATDDHQNGDLGVLRYKYIYKFSKMCVLCVCILIRPPLKIGWNFQATPDATALYASSFFASESSRAFDFRSAS